MSRRFAAVLVSVAIAMPVAALAEVSSGAMTLGYQHGDTTGAKGNVLSFDGIVGVNLGNGISLNTRANTLRGKIDGVPGHANAHLLGLGLAYAFGNGGWGGAYIENGGLSASGIPGSLDYTQYGFEGGFKFSGLDVA